MKSLSVKKAASSTKKSMRTKSKYAPRSSTSRKNKMSVSVATVATIIPKGYFVNTHGEDNIESSFSFLISLMGGSAYELFVKQLNAKYELNIQVVQVNRPSYALENINPVNFQPTIYYGNSKGTHFTASLDGKELWNSYNICIQQDKTDHFCQTFALMYLVHSLVKPKIGKYVNNDVNDVDVIANYIVKEYENLRSGQFMDNAFIAKNVACSIISHLWNKVDREKMQDYIYNETKTIGRDVGHQFVGNGTPNENFFYFTDHFNEYLENCTQISKRQMCNSTFRNKVIIK